jgi:hypothetical protein
MCPLKALTFKFQLQRQFLETMCHQNIEKHPCSHQTRYKPHFCRYRFNINHQIGARITCVEELCKECLAGRVEPATANMGSCVKLCRKSAGSEEALLC